MRIGLRNALCCLALLVAAILFTPLQIAPARADDVTYTVRFAGGSTSARYTGQIQGYDEARYVLDARGGQRISVRLSTDNPQAYFNVSSQGASQALFIGSTLGNDFTGVLPRTGRYVIQVYLMRAAARRGEIANYRLSVSISGGTPVPPLDGDYADGDDGGPDNWIVAGVASNDRLNVRVAPSARAATIARLRNGTVVRNLGCRTRGSSRWCRVETNRGQRGWVNGKFLQEY